MQSNNNKFEALKKQLSPALFETVMSSKGSLDGYHNYIGEDWPGWVCSLVKTRDSGPLDISNFEVALEMLGGERSGKVEVRSVNHWACGYFDQIMVKMSLKNLKALKTLVEIQKALEHYPVLDDNHFLELEHTHNVDMYEACFKGALEKILGLENVSEKNTKLLNKIGLEIYIQDCSYQGDGYLNEESVIRYLEDQYAHKPDKWKNAIKAMKRILKIGGN